MTLIRRAGWVTLFLPIAYFWATGAWLRADVFVVSGLAHLVFVELFRLAKLERDTDVFLGLAIGWWSPIYMFLGMFDALSMFLFRYSFLLGLQHAVWPTAA